MKIAIWFNNYEDIIKTVPTLIKMADALNLAPYYHNQNNCIKLKNDTKIYLFVAASYKITSYKENTFDESWTANLLEKEIFEQIQNITADGKIYAYSHEYFKRKLETMTDKEEKTMYISITNIFKITVDYDKLEKAIFTFEEENDNHIKPYIIMSEGTKQAMIADIEKTVSRYDSKQTYSTCFGCPIAICDKLKDGEIELR